MRCTFGNAGLSSVIASAAKQSRAVDGTLDCFAVLAMTTLRYLAVIDRTDARLQFRGMTCPGYARSAHPHRTGGRREGRALAAPVARLLKKMQAAGTTGSAEITRPSLRDGLHAYMQASWRSACWPPCATTRFSRCAVIPASRYQNPATSRPRELRSSAHRKRTCCEFSRPPLPASRVVTIARNAPPQVRRDARKDRGDLPDDTSEIVCDIVTRRAKNSTAPTDRGR